ncbi:MAG: AraC family transcriptional regulator [Clostridia bacterium]|nr:AraC family transcriptional regulator [Clostridia bacterium]
MLDDLVTILENGVLSATGVVPVVFEGIEHTLKKQTPVAKESKHTSHELLYLRRGRCEFTIDGKTFVLDKGSTLIIRPNAVHSVRIPGDTAEMFVLYFGFSKDIDSVNRSQMMSKTVVTDETKPHSGPSVKVPALLAQTSLESFMNFVEGEDDEENSSSYLILSGKHQDTIRNIVEKIVIENHENQYSKELMMEILTIELMVTLSRVIRQEWEESLRVKNGKARELVFVAKDFIDQNFERGITINEAASYVYLSQGYFTRAFRDELGISPMKYLMQKRIEYACELLEDNEIKVSGIASKAGFSSPQRFNVAFRKNMGMTPMEYRYEHLKKREE